MIFKEKYLALGEQRIDIFCNFASFFKVFIHIILIYR